MATVSVTHLVVLAIILIVAVALIVGIATWIIHTSVRAALIERQRLENPHDLQ